MHLCKNDLTKGSKQVNISQSTLTSTGNIAQKLYAPAIGRVRKQEKN